MLCDKEVMSFLRSCRIRSAVVGVFSFLCFAVCVCTCDSGESGSSLCYACYILGQGLGQVGSWSGRCGRKEISIS